MRDVLEERFSLDQQVEAENQDRDDPEHAADEAPQRKQHRAHGVSARARRRALHRLLKRDGVRQQLVLDEERLKPAEILRQIRPQRGGLLDEARHDEQADQNQDADNRQIDREDREDARHAPFAAAFAWALDEAHERRKPHRNDRADVDEHQRLARRPQRRHHDEDGRGRQHRLEHAPVEFAFGGHRSPPGNRE